MRQITVRSVNRHNELVQESNLVINPSSKIILQHDDNLTMDSMNRIHNYFVSKLESGDNVISLPEATKVLVMEIK